MARRTHSRLELALALLFFLAIVVAGGVGIYYVASQQNREPPDPATVPSTIASAPTAHDAKAVEESQRHARALVAGQRGLSVAVARDGEIIWAEGFGFRDPDRRSTVTPHTRFRTGSVSKTLTAAGVALLYDRKRIDLDAPVQTYVPAYPKKQWTVTTRQLLGDVAGVHRLRGDGGNDQTPRGICGTVDQALKTFAFEPLAFEPGTKYRFSTSGWILVSAVIEGAAGEPFSTFMTREVFMPLGMDRTALEGTDNDADTVAFENRREGDGEAKDPAAADYSCTVGASAFLSTPSDLVRLGSAMMVRQPDATTSGFLKPDTIALFLTPLRLASGASTDFALGWKVESIPIGGEQVRVVRHRASSIGGATSLYLLPERDLALAVMDNVQNTVGVEALALQVAEIFAGLTDQGPGTKDGQRTKDGPGTKH